MIVFTVFWWFFPHDDLHLFPSVHNKFDLTSGLRQDPYRRAQIGVRRVQPLRHLRRHLQAHLPRSGEGGLPLLSSQVSKVLQGFGLQDLQGGTDREERSGNEDPAKNSLKTILNLFPRIFDRILWKDFNDFNRTSEKLSLCIISYLICCVAFYSEFCDK